MRSAVGAHVELLDVLRLGAELLVGLHVNPVGTVVEVEIVHIRGTHVDAQSIGDLLQGHVQALRFFAIDGHHELGIVSGVGAEEAGQVFAGAALADQVLGHVRQFFQSVAALVLQFVGKAAEVSQALHRRRQERKHDRAGDAEQAAANPVHDGFGSVRISFALGIRLQRDEDQRPVRGAAAEAEPATAKVPRTSGMS